MMLNEMTLWLLGTAIIFTVVGWFYGKKGQMQEVIEATIDSLIEEGYLKTRGSGKNMEILKWREWDND